MPFPDVEVDRYLEYLDQDSPEVLVKVGIRHGCQSLGYDSLDEKCILSDRLTEIVSQINWQVDISHQGDYEANIIHQAEMLTIKSIAEYPPEGTIPF